MNYWLGIIVFAGGVWELQDAIASILYYLKHDDESLVFNQLLRILRAFWGIVLIVCGAILLKG